MVRRGRGESGVAMLLTLVVLLLLGIALALIAGSLAHRLKLAQNDAETVILSALTDASIAEGLADLARNANSPGIPQHKFGAGSIESRITPLGSSSYTLIASALYGDRRRNVEAIVQRTPEEIRVVRWRRLDDELGEDAP